MSVQSEKMHFKKIDENSFKSTNFEVNIQKKKKKKE